MITISPATYLGVLARLATDPATFRHALAAEMARRAMTQRALAYRAGLNHSTVNRILSGECEPALTTAARLAQAVVTRWPIES